MCGKSRPHGVGLLKSVWIGRNDETNPVAFLESLDSPVNGVIDIYGIAYDMAISNWELYITNDPALNQGQSIGENVKAQITYTNDIIASGTNNIGVPGNPYLAQLLSTYDTTQVSDGTWSIVLIVYDKSGNMSGYSITFDIDNTAPNVNIITPNEDDLLGNSDSVDFEWTISDASFYNWELYLGGATNPEATGTINDSHSYTINDISSIFSNVDARYGFRVRAIDAAGNIGQHLISVLVDTISPELDSSTSSNSGQDLELQFSEDMDTSTFIAANFTYTGSGSIDSVGAGTSDEIVELDISTPVDGDTITITTNLKDEAGNQLAQAEVCSFDGLAWTIQ